MKNFTSACFIGMKIENSLPKHEAAMFLSGTKEEKLKGKWVKC